MAFDVCPETLLDLNKRLCPMAHTISNLGEKIGHVHTRQVHVINICRAQGKENQVLRIAFFVFLQGLEGQ